LFLVSFVSATSFFLIQKKQKFKKRLSANAQADRAPATFSGKRTSLKRVRCDGCPRKVRTTSFVAMGRRIFVGKTKACGWFSWALFLCFFLLEKQKKEKCFFEIALILIEDV